MANENGDEIPHGEGEQTQNDGPTTVENAAPTHAYLVPLDEPDPRDEQQAITQAREDLAEMQSETQESVPESISSQLDKRWRELQKRFLLQRKEPTTREKMKMKFLRPFQKVSDDTVEAYERNTEATMNVNEEHLPIIKKETKQLLAAVSSHVPNLNVALDRATYLGYRIYENTFRDMSTISSLQHLSKISEEQFHAGLKLLDEYPFLNFGMEQQHYDAQSIAHFASLCKEGGGYYKRYLDTAATLLNVLDQHNALDQDPQAKFAHSFHRDDLTDLSYIIEKGTNFLNAQYLYDTLQKDPSLANEFMSPFLDRLTFSLSDSEVVLITDILQVCEYTTEPHLFSQKFTDLMRMKYTEKKYDANKIVRMKQVLASLINASTLPDEKKMFKQTALRLFSGKMPEVYYKFCSEKEVPANQSLEEYLNAIWKKVKDQRGFRINSIENMLDILDKSLTDDEMFNDIVLSDIASTVAVDSFNERSDIEEIDETIEQTVSITKAKMVTGSPSVFLRNYIFRSLPSGVDVMEIDEMREVAERCEGFNPHLLSWIHEAVHNYPNPENVTLFQAFLQFAQTRTKEDFKNLQTIASVLNPRSQPPKDVYKAKDTMLEALVPHVEKLYEGLKRYYNPNLDIIIDKIYAMEPDLQPDVYAQIKRSLYTAQAISTLSPKNAISLVDDITSSHKHLNVPDIISGSAEKWSMLQADLHLERASETIFQRAVDSIEQESTNLTQIDSSFTFSINNVAANIVDFLASSGISPDFTPEMKKYFVNMLQTDYKTQADALHHAKIAIDGLLVGYQKSWQQISGILRPLLVEKAMNNNKSPAEAEALASHTYLVNIQKESPWINGEVQLRRLATLADSLLQKVNKNELIDIASDQQRTEAERRRTNKELEAYTSQENLADTSLAMKDEILHELGDIVIRPDDTTQIAHEKINTVRNSSYAKAYRLLEAVEGKQGELDKSMLAKNAFHITYVNGVPLLYMNRIRTNEPSDPYEYLINKYQREQKLVKAQLNYVKEGD